MKVMYEFDAKDVAQLIADKYGISVHKVSANCDFEDVIFKLDMSEDETPDDKIIANLQKGNPENLKKILSENTAPARQEIRPLPPIGGTEKEKFDYNLYQEHQYKLITDDMLADCISKKECIKDLCRKFGLDSTRQSRIYKRVEKLKKECASND